MTRTTAEKLAMIFTAAALTALPAACGDVGEADADVEQDAVDLDDTQDAAAPTEGSFGMLIYNVAGLPEELSGSDPVVNMPQIAPKLNAYDLVIVQEDFWYHADLETGTTHPYKSEPMWESPDWDKMGDGLNTFSYMPFTPVTRVAWEHCNGYLDSGSDCLTNKGFTWSRLEIQPGIFIDLYDLHMDASGNAEDIAARKAQAIQLAAFINGHSDGNAILLGGDTNLKATRPEDLETLDDFLKTTDLADSCRTLECGDERIDRIMFRSSADLTLAPVEWRLPTEFVDDDGVPLSDHLPVLVEFAWSINN